MKRIARKCLIAISTPTSLFSGRNKRSFSSMAHSRMAALVICLCIITKYSEQQDETGLYTISGTGNNLLPNGEDWGKANSPFLRIVPAEYDNSNRSNPSQPTGSDRPSARAVSLALTRDPDNPYPAKRLSSRNSTAMLTYYGQFVSHDINKRKNMPQPTAEDHILAGVQNDDAYFSQNGVGRTKLNVTRSAFVVVDNVRQQLNAATAFLDLSVIYSTNATTLSKMRSFKDGQLIMGGPNGMDLPLLLDLGFTQEEINEYQSAYKDTSALNLRAVGDSRGNQNPGSLAIRTLYFRNHNRLAKLYAANCTDCSDEALFQAARRRNIAVAQAIAFYEYVPQLGIHLDLYSGYKSDVDPGIDNFFSTVAYRYGHSEVTDSIWRIQDDGTEHPDGHLQLAASYFNPDLALSAGIEPILRGLSLQLQGQVEPFFSPSVQQCLFGPSYVNGTDLITINVLRGRDHGIPGYNSVRQSLGLSPLPSWAQVTSNSSWQTLLNKTYPLGPDTCDPYICGLAEDKVNGSHFGELFYLTMKQQYERIRDGDRLYFENNSTDPNTKGPGFTTDEINQLKVYGLYNLILDNTFNMSLPVDVFNTHGIARPMATDITIAEAAVAAEVELVPNGYYLTWRFDKNEIEITVRAKGDGWIGFGVPQGYNTFMVNADMVIGSQQDNSGTLGVQDYYSFTLGQKPVPDVALGATNSISDASIERDGDWTKMKFRRSVDAQDQKYDRAITPDTPQWIVFAWHPSAPVLQQHFSDTRGQALISWRKGQASKSAVVPSRARRVRHIHGVLMALSFVLLLPLGAQLARSLRYSIISDRRAKAFCFYCHVICQITAVVLSSIGLSIALTQFNKPYYKVQHRHGVLGLAIMAFLYLQFLIGIIRPPGNPRGELSRMRRIWDVVHSVLGPLVIMLGIGNVVLGIYLLTTLGYARLETWAALCATSVIAIAWLQKALDRAETLHLAKVLAKKQEADQADQFSEPVKTGAQHMPFLDTPVNRAPSNGVNI